MLLLSRRFLLVLFLVGLIVSNFPSESAKQCYKCGPSTNDNSSKCTGNYKEDCNLLDTDMFLADALTKGSQTESRQSGSATYLCAKVAYKDGTIMKNCLLSDKSEQCKEETDGTVCVCKPDLCNKGMSTWSMQTSPVGILGSIALLAPYIFG